MVNMENYEEYMLLYADGELNEAEEKALLAFVEEHPQLKEELKLYAAARIAPDTTQIFEGKEQLMKTAPAKRTIALDKRWFYTAAAACVAMIVFFIFKNNHNGTTNEPVIVNNTPVITPIDERPVQPADTEELHSTPVNPISAKPVPKQQPAMVAEHKKKQPTANPQKQKAFVARQNETKPVVSEEHTPIVTPQKQIEKQQPVLVKNEEEQSIDSTPAAREKDNTLLDVIGKRDRLEGAMVIAQAFDDKIEKVKKIKRKIQDTDVALKIGKREFLIVRL